ncbi:MAG: DUF3267 domain-containing protein [Faecalibacterium sp.]|nr:DUF3267 domain-containing protein [Ruminococcus sp.]MCM1391499.1 DUF3267 domain-containing protein [Ruminococcus sp.]MCM1485863.1 DUF3267 domain-containing protein [Faecalibacterium sp.]
MNTVNLPSAYEKIMEFDLVRNRKEVIIVNAISIVLTVLMLAIGIFSFGSERLSEFLLTDSFEEFNSLVFKCVITILLCMIVIILHEMIHAAFIKLFCKDCRLKFSRRLFYAYASSNAYFDKKSYNIIAVAPLLIIGVISLGACFLVPIEWFWVFYIVEVINVSGAAGDIYVFAITSRMPKDILINDTGRTMGVYGKR